MTKLKFIMTSKQHIRQLSEHLYELMIYLLRLMRPDPQDNVGPGLCTFLSTPIQRWGLSKTNFRCPLTYWCYAPAHPRNKYFGITIRVRWTLIHTGSVVEDQDQCWVELFQTRQRRVGRSLYFHVPYLSTSTCIASFLHIRLLTAYTTKSLR